MRSVKQIFKDFLIKGGLRRAELSEDELKQVIDAGTLSGAIDKTEHELIKSILEFSDITAKEIMVPRPDIVALDISMPRDVLVSKVIEEGYSRLPVYRGSIDNIIGIIYSKDLLSMIEHRDLIILQDVIRKAHFVPESKKISALLREFQQKKVHMAIVVDEFGGVEGLITMEDIIEEIVGEILDEYDESHRDIRQTGDDTMMVDAAMTVGDFNSRFEAAVPELADYETLAGFLQKGFGKVPEIGEEYRAFGFSFMVAAKTARRIREIKVKRIEPTEIEPAE